jgi:hypothetical protein
VCICGAPAAARAESEDDPVWIDEVWPGLAAQLDQVVQAHAAGDGLAPREVQGKSNSTADLLRRCRGNGNAEGLADRLGSVRVCCSADLSGTWSYQVQQSRPFSARGSLGQRQIQSVEQFFQPNLELLGAVVLTEQRLEPGDGRFPGQVELSVCVGNVG